MDSANARGHDLKDIIEQKLASLIREMEDADWQAEDVVLAIEAVIKTRWLDRFESLNEARTATPKDFVSDGNEG